MCYHQKRVLLGHRSRWHLFDRSPDSQESMANGRQAGAKHAQHLVVWAPLLVLGRQLEEAQSPEKNDWHWKAKVEHGQQRQKNKPQQGAQKAKAARANGNTPRL